MDLNPLNPLCSFTPEHGIIELRIIALNMTCRIHGRKRNGKEIAPN
jgi:hypothetical protein